MRIEQTEWISWMQSEANEWWKEGGKKEVWFGAINLREQDGRAMAQTEHEAVIKEEAAERQPPRP